MLRMQRLPSPDALARSTSTSPTSSRSGQIEPRAASKAEIADDDVPDLARLRMRFDRHSYSRLRALIDRLNESA